MLLSLGVLACCLGEAVASDFYYHLVCGIEKKYSQVTLEDGSVWEIHPHYRPLVKAWKVDDTLLITPNHRFERSPFDLTNLRLKTYATAMLIKAPQEEGPYTCTLAAYDLSHGLVFIKSQGYFYRYRVEPKDQGNLAKWRVGEPVIVGTNEWWLARLFSDCHSLLIDPKTQDFIRIQLE